MELVAAAEESKETTFDIKHTAPQHRQYLEYGVSIYTLHWDKWEAVIGGYVRIIYCGHWSGKCCHC